MSPKIGGTLSLFFAIPLVVTGVIIALVRVAEMTFLPMILNAIRLSLNGQERPWSQGTDGFNEFVDIGYYSLSNSEKMAKSEGKSFHEVSRADDFSENLKNL